MISINKKCLKLFVTKILKAERPGQSWLYCSRLISFDDIFLLVFLERSYCMVKGDVAGTDVGAGADDDVINLEVKFGRFF